MNEFDMYDNTLFSSAYEKTVRERGEDKKIALQNLTKESSSGIAKVAIKTTYSELKKMRDEKKLSPGCWYRITDFVSEFGDYDRHSYACLVSGHHPFDVIVLATTESTLSPDAYAAEHEGDTYFSDNYSNPSLWKLKYSLDSMYFDQKDMYPKFSWGVDERNYREVLDFTANRVYRSSEYQGECEEIRSLQFTERYTGTLPQELIEYFGTSWFVVPGGFLEGYVETVLDIERRRGPQNIKDLGHGLKYREKSENAKKLIQVKKDGEDETENQEEPTRGGDVRGPQQQEQEAGGIFNIVSVNYYYHELYGFNTTTGEFGNVYCSGYQINEYGDVVGSPNKGVIYSMTDDWGNTLPYDFKNLQWADFYVEKETLESITLPLTYVGDPGTSTEVTFTKDQITGYGEYYINLTQPILQPYSYTDPDTGDLVVVMKEVSTIYIEYYGGDIYIGWESEDDYSGEFSYWNTEYSEWEYYYLTQDHYTTEYVEFYPYTFTYMSQESPYYTVNIDASLNGHYVCDIVIDGTNNNTTLPTYMFTIDRNSDGMWSSQFCWTNTVYDEETGNEYNAPVIYFIEEGVENLNINSNRYSGFEDFITIYIENHVNGAYITPGTIITNQPDENDRYIWECSGSYDTLYGSPSGGGSSSNDWFGTQEEFDNLESYDEDTNYYIEGDLPSGIVTGYNDTAYTLRYISQADYDLLDQPDPNTIYLIY